MVLPLARLLLGPQGSHLALQFKDGWPVLKCHFLKTSRGEVHLGIFLREQGSSHSREHGLVLQGCGRLRAGRGASVSHSRGKLFFGVHNVVFVCNCHQVCLHKW